MVCRGGALPVMSCLGRRVLVGVRKTRAPAGNTSNDAARLQTESTPEPSWIQRSNQKRSFWAVPGSVYEFCSWLCVSIRV